MANDIVAPKRRSEPSPRIAVLVHGGFHGGWCWDKVRPLLEEDGWTVRTPTLTGLGERANLASPEVTLRTHVQDVVDLIEGEGLTDVVLLGHSAAGMVITAVADVISERLHALVYLDAVIPHDGESMFDIVGPVIASTDMQRARELGNGWLVPAESFSACADFGVTEPIDIAWVEQNLTGHPIRAFADPLTLTSGAPVVLSRIAVRCTEHQNRPHLDRELTSLETTSGWTVFRWPSAHDVMVTEPGRIRELFVWITHSRLPEDRVGEVG